MENEFDLSETEEFEDIPNVPRTYLERISLRRKQEAMTAPRAPVQRLSAAPRDGDGDACYRVVVEFALSRDGGS